jgi:hypothetical protein
MKRRLLDKLFRPGVNVTSLIFKGRGTQKTKHGKYSASGHLESSSAHRNTSGHKRGDSTDKNA